MALRYRAGGVPRESCHGHSGRRTWPDRLRVCWTGRCLLPPGHRPVGRGGQQLRAARRRDRLSRPIWAAASATSQSRWPSNRALRSSFSSRPSRTESRHRLHVRRAVLCQSAAGGRPRRDQHASRHYGDESDDDGRPDGRRLAARRAAGRYVVRMITAARGAVFTGAAAFISVDAGQGGGLRPSLQPHRTRRWPSKGRRPRRVWQRWFRRGRGPRGPGQRHRARRRPGDGNYRHLPGQRDRERRRGRLVTCTPANGFSGFHADPKGPMTRRHERGGIKLHRVSIHADPKGPTTPSGG